MKISEVALKTEEQFHEDMKQSVQLTINKFGNKVLSRMGVKAAKEEALVLETIDQLYKSFLSYSKASGTKPTYADLAGFLRSAGITNPVILSSFKSTFSGTDPEQVSQDDQNKSSSDEKDKQMDGGKFNEKGEVDVQKLTDPVYRKYIQTIIDKIRNRKQLTNDDGGRNTVNLKFRGGFKIGDQVLFTPDPKKVADRMNRAGKGPVGPEDIKSQPKNAIIMGRDPRRNNYFILQTATNKNGFSIPQDRLTKAQGQGTPVPQESVIREFKGDDVIPEDKIRAGIEAAIRAQYKANGLMNVTIPEYMGNPSKETEQLMINISQEMDQQVQNLDKDKDGQIDKDKQGGGETQPGGGETQPGGDETQPDGDEEQYPEIDNEKINAIAMSIFKLTGPERELLTQVIRNRNIQLSKDVKNKYKQIDQQQDRQSQPEEEPEMTGGSAGPPKPSQSATGGVARDIGKGTKDAVATGAKAADFMSGN